MSEESFRGGKGNFYEKIIIHNKLNFSYEKSSISKFLKSTIYVLYSCHQYCMMQIYTGNAFCNSA